MNIGRLSQREVRILVSEVVEEPGLHPNVFWPRFAGEPVVEVETDEDGDISLLVGSSWSSKPIFAAVAKPNEDDENIIIGMETIGANPKPWWMTKKQFKWVLQFTVATALHQSRSTAALKEVFEDLESNSPSWLGGFQFSIESDEHSVTMFLEDGDDNTMLQAEMCWECNHPPFVLNSEGQEMKDHFPMIPGISDLQMYNTAGFLQEYVMKAREALS